MPYSVLATQDILGAVTEYEAGDVPLRLSDLDSSVAGKDAMDVEQLAQVVHAGMMTVDDRIKHLEY